MHSHSPRKTKEWLRHLLPLLQPFRKQLCWVALAMALDAVLTVFRPWPLKVVIDRVLSQKPTRVPLLGEWLNSDLISQIDILYGACATTILIALGTGLLTYYYTRRVGDAAQRFIYALRCKLFAHIQRLSLRFHDRQRTGDLITRLTSDTQAIQDVTAGGIIVFGSNVLLLAGMLVVMFWLDWRFACAALSVAPL